MVCFRNCDCFAPPHSLTGAYPTGDGAGGDRDNAKEDGWTLVALGSIDNTRGHPSSFASKFATTRIYMSIYSWDVGDVDKSRGPAFTHGPSDLPNWI